MVLNERLKRKITLALEIIGAILLAVAFILLIRLYVTSPQKTFGKFYNIFKSFEFWTPLVLFAAIAVARLTNRDNEKFKVVFRFAILIFAIYFAYTLLRYAFRADGKVVHSEEQSLSSKRIYIYHRVYERSLVSAINVLCYIAIAFFAIRLHIEIYSLRNLTDRQKTLNTISMYSAVITGVFAFRYELFFRSINFFAAFFALAIMQCFLFVKDVVYDNSKSIRILRNVGCMVIGVLLLTATIIGNFENYGVDIIDYGVCGECFELIIGNYNGRFDRPYVAIAFISAFIIVSMIKMIIQCVFLFDKESLERKQTNDIVNKISELKELFEMGIITETEFTEKKEKLIAEFKEKSNETSK